MMKLSPAITQIRMYGHVWQCFGERGPGGRFKYTNGRRNMYLSPSELNLAFAEGKAKQVHEIAAAPQDPVTAATTPFDLASLPDDVRAKVRRMDAYVQAVMKQRADGEADTNAGLELLIKRVAKETEDGDPPHLRTLQRWVSAYEGAGCSLEALVPDRKGNTLPRLHKDVRRLLHECIALVYLAPTRQPMTKVHEALCRAIREENRLRPASDQLVAPSRGAVRRSIDRLDKYDVTAARYGVAYANKVFHTYMQTPALSHALEVVQVDHTLLDIYVTHKGILLTRPWLTLFLDVKTRCIVGYFLGFEPPSYASVMEGLGRAILGKEGLIRRIGEPGWSYPMRGVPGTLLVDNGKEFRGNDLKDACLNLGITLEFTPPRQPWFKAQVERMFGILMTELIHALPGRVMKPGDPGEKTKEFAYVEYEKLDKLILQWITTVYHQAPHVALGDTPAGAWAKSELECPVVVPFSDANVMVFLGKSVKRTVKPRGIELFCARYNSDELSTLRRHLRKNTKVTLKFCPWDLGHIYVQDPFTKTYLPVPAVDQETMTGRTLHRHMVTLALARVLHKKMSANDAYLTAEKELHEAIKNLSTTELTKVSRRLSRYLMDSQVAEDLLAKTAAESGELGDDDEAVSESTAAASESQAADPEPAAPADAVTAKKPRGRPRKAPNAGVIGAVSSPPPGPHPESEAVLPQRRPAIATPSVETAPQPPADVDFYEAAREWM